VEAVDGVSYRRTLALDGARGSVEIRADRDATRLLARVRLDRPALLIGVTERLRRIFDLGADPAEIASDLQRDRRLARRLERQPGVRVPGAWDGFELAVRAILGQQVSVAGATTLAGRLVAAYGEPAPEGADPELGFFFPTAEALTDADPARLGLPRARGAAIAALARAVAGGDLRLDSSGNLEESLAQLQELPGIGPWTAQLIAMRALGEPDALPAGDLGLRRSFGRAGKLASAAEVEARAEAWRPWRAYGAMLFWGQAR
jgi:AraC family transcriptional regulator of adaptative response / DNA-3-methyladenine glycosylase II